MKTAKTTNKPSVSTNEGSIDRLKPKYWVKITAGEDQNQYIRLAFDVSGGSLDFILTLEQENGLWTWNRKHPLNKDGSRDWGFCGLNSTYHTPFIKSDGFKDPRTQLEYCWNIYKKKPYRFYGHKVRLKHKSKFERK